MRSVRELITMTSALMPGLCYTDGVRQSAREAKPIMDSAKGAKKPPPVHRNIHAPFLFHVALTTHKKSGIYKRSHSKGNI